MARERLSVTLPDSLLKAIDEKVAESGSNRSQIVERLIMNGLRPETDEPGYYENMVFRGNTEETVSFLKYLTDPESSHTFEPGWYRMVKFYVKTKPGAQPFGSLHLTGSSSEEARQKEPTGDDHDQEDPQ